MAARQHGFRGLSQDQELNSKDLYRDIRTPPTQKVADFFSDTGGGRTVRRSVAGAPSVRIPPYFLYLGMPANHLLGHQSPLLSSSNTSDAASGRSRDY